MQTVKLTDQFGLDVDAQPAEGSALTKYFQQVPSLLMNHLDLSKLGGVTLDQSPVSSLTTGVSFQQPVDLGTGAPALSVAAGSHATLSVINDLDDLPGQGLGVPTLPDSCYVSFGIDATASAGVSVTEGELKFGATPSAKVTLASYTRLAPKTAVTLVDGIKRAVGGFSIPAHCADLAALPAGQIARVATTGKLTLSGSANLLAVTNPLAAANLPAPLTAASVSAGGSATIGVSCAIETDYEIVVRKLDSGSVRLGWYHKNGTTVTVSATVSEGIATSLGGRDLFTQVIGLISANPQADLAELAGAGVPADQAEAIQAAVKACAARKLEVAVTAAFTASSSQTASFLYEIAPEALSGDAGAAVERALRGDLSGLHEATFPGVSCVNSIWDTLRKHGLELDVNLLGILNYRSVASLALEGKVLFEPATGAMVITDKATASRIQSLQLNFGADTDKLRKVLAESFLITAAYHGSKQLSGAASLHCSHSFFELLHSADRSAIARMLETGFALGLLSAAETELPATTDDFGRTLFSVSTDYDDELVSRMFVDSNGIPQPREWYETAGRNAIQILVREDDDDAVRRQPAIDDSLWKRMKDVGQPGFGSLFLGVAAPLLGAITTDYTAIVWWADAMEKTAQELVKSRQWVERNPSAGLDDPDFQALRKSLADYLRQVAANTHEQFGQPWGLIAMNQLVGRAAGARLTICSATLARSKKRDLSAVIGK